MTMDQMRAIVDSKLAGWKPWTFVEWHKYKNAYEVTSWITVNDTRLRMDLELRGTETAEEVANKMWIATVESVARNVAQA